MNRVNTHQQQLEKFKAASDHIVSSKERSINFLVKIGINKPDGRLTKNYSK
ncbi:hypothetical protein LJC68_08060 [Bacteroidales bacterium OttesenSCG-928-B11]|nr:hypothetical protein [Bacteroidales bacterium OttesenSCG-928-B11]MDL2326475.1 hypothetical protein [Bacteroidales bacterium OttesenSCG-928-A14]